MSPPIEHHKEQRARSMSEKGWRLSFVAVLFHCYLYRALLRLLEMLPPLTERAGARHEKREARVGTVSPGLFPSIWSCHKSGCFTFSIHPSVFGVAVSWGHWKSEAVAGTTTGIAAIWFSHFFLFAVSIYVPVTPLVAVLYTLRCCGIQYYES